MMTPRSWWQLALLILTVAGLAACAGAGPVPPAAPAATPVSSPEATPVPVATAVEPVSVSVPPANAEKPTPTGSASAAGDREDTADAAQLIGTQWMLQSLGNADAPQPVLDGTTITLQFTADGELSGNAGCNLYFGPFKTEGERLIVGVIGATERACMATGVDQQEQAYLAALRAAVSYAVEDGELAIAYGDGTGLLRYAADEASGAPTEPASESTPGAFVSEPLAGSLVSTAWDLVSYGPAEAQTAIVPGSRVYVQFDPGNVVSGNASCNSYTGRYETAADGKLTIGPLSVTRQPCREPLDQQEAAYLEALRTVYGYARDESELRLLFDEGTGVLNYRRGQLEN